MTLRTRLAVPMLCLSLALGACAGTAQLVSNVATSLSTATPKQAATLAEALQVATLTTQAVDLYVTTASPSRATLVELQTLNEAVHTALVNLQAANAAGQSLAFAAFNEALSAFSAYATAKGVVH